MKQKRVILLLDSCVCETWNHNLNSDAHASKQGNEDCLQAEADTHETSKITK
jgi:hypothetical protein